MVKASNSTQLFAGRTGLAGFVRLDDLVVIHTQKAARTRIISARKLPEARERHTMRKEVDFSKAKKGAIIPSPGKTRITIMLDDDVIEYFRVIAEKQGSGYQTKINAALRSAMQVPDATQLAPTLDDIRAVVREELNSIKAA